MAAAIKSDLTLKLLLFYHFQIKLIVSFKEQKMQNKLLKGWFYLLFPTDKGYRLVKMKTVLMVTFCQLFLYHQADF